MAYADLQSDDDREDDGAPYDTVSDRVGTPDFAAPQSSISDAVKSSIAQKAAPPPAAPSPSLDSLLKDPLMSVYNQDQAKLDQSRQAKIRGDLIANIGQSFSQASLGAGAPKPTNLYENIDKQNQEVQKYGEDDAERRQKVIQSIEQRKSREGVASENRLGRQALAQNSLASKDANQDNMINRTMGQVVSRINQDPIIKPSEMNLASLQKSQSILNNTNVPLTPQSLSDAEQDAASALQLRSMGATEGKIKRTEIETIGRKIAEFKQKWGNNPAIDLRKEQPELVEQIKKLNQSLIDDYHTTISSRKNAVLDELQAVYGDNPKYQDRISKLRKTFNASTPAPEPVKSGGSSTPMAGDVEDGHRFKGGNPADPNNWEMVK